MLFSPESGVPRSPCESGELIEEAFDIVARAPFISPRTTRSLRSIDAQVGVITPNIKGGIKSALSCALSPAEHKIDTEERAKDTLEYIALSVLPERRMTPDS